MGGGGVQRSTLAVFLDLFPLYFLEIWTVTEPGILPVHLGWLDCQPRHLPVSISEALTGIISWRAVYLAFQMGAKDPNSGSPRR